MNHGDFVIGGTFWCSGRQWGCTGVGTQTIVAKRALSANMETKLGNHTFRVTGITAYLKNGGTLEKTAVVANLATTRTTQLYDRRHDEMSLDEVERILI